jgi:hypothetical protein
MQAAIPITDIGRVIQLSVAPVFLISGVGALLAVLSARLGRTIDRARVLESLFANAEEAAKLRIGEELEILARRAKLIYRAIAFGVSCALLICFVIVSLFISALGHFPISIIVGTLFILAMIALIAALLSFMREVFLATRILRIGPR